MFSFATNFHDELPALTPVWRAAPRPRFLAAAVALALAASCGPRSAPDAISIAVPHEADTLDPHAKNTLSNFALTFNLYEALVTTDAEMRIRPSLARYWENPDASTWVFHLEPGVLFHSGRPLRAQDVVYSIERLRRDDRLEVAGYVLYIAELGALGPSTVRIRTSRPLSVLLNKLRFVAIIPEGATGDSLRDRPDGTGPYRLVEWQQGQRIRMARNERYWGRKPALRDVTLWLDRSPSQAADDMLSGRCQLVQCSSKSALSRVAGLKRVELLRRPSFLLKYIGYDLARDVTPHADVRPNPFRDRRVRQAIHLAIDRQRLVAELSTNAVPATQLVPPSIFGFNPEIPAPRHDPAQARRLLEQAGLPNGFSATLHVRKIFAEAAYLVRDQLSHVGLRLDVIVLGDDDFLARARRREFSLFLSRIGAGTGDASDILDTGVHSPDPARRMGVSNMGGYSNPAVDRAIEESAGIDPVLKRRSTLEAIMSLVMEDLAWIPLYVDEDVYALDRGFSWRPRNDSFILAAEASPRER